MSSTSLVSACLPALVVALVASLARGQLLDVRKMNTSHHLLPQGLSYEYGYGDCKVYLMQDPHKERETMFKERADQVQITEGDEYNMTFECRLDWPEVLAYYSDIASINVTQYSKDREQNRRVGITTFVFNRTYNNVSNTHFYKVTQVRPFNRFLNRSARTLATSISHPDHPDFRYVTNLTPRDSHGKILALRAMNKISVMTHNAYEGHFLPVGDNNVHMEIFVNPYYFYMFNRSQDSYYNKSIRNPFDGRRAEYIPYRNHTHFSMDYDKTENVTSSEEEYEFTDEEVETIMHMSNYKMSPLQQIINSNITELTLPPNFDKKNSSVRNVLSEY